MIEMPKQPFDNHSRREVSEAPKQYLIHHSRREASDIPTHSDQYIYIM
jgi:hypothetical protein